MSESIAKQKNAVQKQVGPPPPGGFFTTAWVGPALILPPNVTADCDPIDDAQSAPLIATAATREQLEPALLRAVIRQESAFRPCAVSSKGAKGLMQLMPATLEQFRVADPFNAEQNINAGAQFLHQLLTRFNGDLKVALAAYNAGPERIDASAPAVPQIPETEDYVTQILKALKDSQPESAGSKIAGK